MKGILAGSFCLAIGWLASSTMADEVQWRPARSRPQSPAATPQVSASLGRPIPQQTVPPGAIHDPLVVPASFSSTGRLPGRPLVRFQGADPVPELPTPVWPSDEQPPSDKPRADSPSPERLQPRPTPADTSSPYAPSMLAPGGGPTQVPPAPGCWESGWPGDPGAPAARRLYGSAEYLLWWIKDADVPPLVTTSPPGSQGILGMPGTVVLFGGSNTDLNERSGGRFTLGWWLDPCQVWGIETSFFFLGEDSAGFGANSDQFPLLARPFFNLNLDTEFSQVVTDPTRATGGLSVSMPSRLWGGEVNLRRNVYCTCCSRVDLLAGFRYLDLDESVQVVETGTILPTVQPFGGNRFAVFDHFGTNNQFYGGQIGAEAEVRRGRWFATVRGKLALGVNDQSVDINGAQTLVAPNGTRSTFQSGLLALNSNSGRFNREHFAVVPEAGVNLGYHVTDSIRAYVGYTFLYWTDVLRPGDQIDRVLDVNRIPNFSPGPAVSQVRPRVPFKRSDFWAQGMNFGLEVKY